MQLRAVCHGLINELNQSSAVLWEWVDDSRTSVIAALCGESAGDVSGHTQ